MAKSAGLMSTRIRHGSAGDHCRTKMRYHARSKFRSTGTLQDAYKMELKTYIRIGRTEIADVLFGCSAILRRVGTSVANGVSSFGCAVVAITRSASKVDFIRDESIVDRRMR